MSSAPYKVTGPACISFSGGRTSAYMLHAIIQAHDGQLPADIIPIFANTGKEREETLRFVHECGSRWGANVQWVEWRDNIQGFEFVGYNSASRAGEPFERLIEKKQRLPNWKERWCTQYLKVLPIFACMRELLFLEPGQYTEVIGLRHDEGLRILKGMERAERDARRVTYPLAKAKVVKADIKRFWLGDPLPQGFDLGLEDYEGNCDLCFLKGQAIRKRIIRDNPLCPKWWAQQESVERGNGQGWFDRRARVADLVRQVYQSPEFDEYDSEREEYDVECGLSCGA